MLSIRLDISMRSKNKYTLYNAIFNKQTFKFISLSMDCNNSSINFLDTYKKCVRIIIVLIYNNWLSKVELIYASIFVTF